jgi:hypothetical protein
VGKANAMSAQQDAILWMIAGLLIAAMAIILITHP